MSFKKEVPTSFSHQKHTHGRKGWEGCALCGKIEGALGSYPILLAQWGFHKKLAHAACIAVEQERRKQ